MCHVLWPNNNNSTIAYHATARSIIHHSIVGDSFGKKRRNGNVDLSDSRERSRMYDYSWFWGDMTSMFQTRLDQELCSTS
ncbi:histone H3-like centromeric protein hH3v [Fusarium oxysporum f. sp. albedinis]|nr:histone H3-like centromeric protein hH3v [Fusarium oxysporum f. sp. albedinis]